MIKSKLAQLMADKKIRSISELARETNLNRRTLTNLYDDKNNGIDYATLEALCKFFQCNVGDILVYEGEND
jgi:putative transcriptional regulator